MFHQCENVLEFRAAGYGKQVACLGEHPGGHVRIVDDFLAGFEDGLFGRVGKTFVDEAQFAFFLIVALGFAHHSLTQRLQRFDKSDEEGGVNQVESRVEGCQHISQTVVGHHTFDGGVHVDKVAQEIDEIREDEEHPHHAAEVEYRLSEGCAAGLQACR